jgi:hypothetical protein
LEQLKGLAKLKRLWLDKTAITQTEKQSLQQAMPNLNPVK